MRPVVVGLAVAAAVLGLGGPVDVVSRSAPATASTAQRGKLDETGSRLVFVSTRTGLWQIYAYGAVPGRLRQLTFDTGTNVVAPMFWSEVVVAPDGSAMAAAQTRGLDRTPNPAILEPDGVIGRQQAALERKSSMDGLPRQPWSPDGRWLLFERREGTDETGHGCTAIVALERSQSPDARRVFSGDNEFSVWSPDGTRVAALRRAPAGPCDIAYTDTGNLVVRTLRGGSTRTVMRDVRVWAYPSWSPDGRWLAVVVGNGASGQVVVVPASGGRARIVTGLGVTSSVSWSPRGDWIAYLGAGALRLVRPDGSGRRVISATRPGCASCEPRYEWSPDGRFLAVADRTGLRLLSAAKRKARRLVAEPVGDIAWSPSGASLAFEATARGSLRVVEPNGQARTLASALGDVTSLQWARPPAGDGARTPERAEPLIRSGANELRLRRPIDELVADGDRVALRVCGDVVESWHVTTGVRVELLPTWAPPPHTHYACESELGQLLENPCHYTRDLALSDLGLAFLFGDGCAGRFWDLDLQVTPGVDLVKLAWTDGWGGAGPRGLGWTRGSGNLLVFSDLHTIWRVRPPGFPGACPTMPWQSSGTAPGPCQRLTTEPGRWVPYAVDGSRIVAAGDDAVVLLDGDGHRLRSVTVHALAAALSGDELVVLTPGWIRDFNTDTGELEHSWPRPEVASGGCADVDHWWDTDDCLAPRVEGVDSARGLVAMAIDGRIHLIRLADGVDVVLAEGSVARFVSSGIVYASRARSNDPTYPWRLIHVPFEMLPLASADE